MNARGHILLEVMLSGALLLLASVGVVGGLNAASRQVSTASHRALAEATLAAQLDALRAAPLASWQAAAGSTVSAACPVTLPMASCTVSTTYSPVLTDGYSSAIATPPQYLEASVTLSYCDLPPCASNTQVFTQKAARYLQ